MCENLTCSAKVGDGGLLEPWGNTRASTVYLSIYLSVFSITLLAKEVDTGKAVSTCTQLSLSHLSVEKESEERGTLCGSSLCNDE